MAPRLYNVAMIEHHNNIPNYVMKIILDLWDVIVEVVGAFLLLNLAQMFISCSLCRRGAIKVSFWLK